MAATSGNFAPKPNQPVVSKRIVVSKPAPNTGNVIGAICKKNSIKSQPTRSPINKFCGSPTNVHTPPKAVPTTPCMIKLLKKLRNCSKVSPLNSFLSGTPSSLKSADVLEWIL